MCEKFDGILTKQSVIVMIVKKFFEVSDMLTIDFLTKIGIPENDAVEILFYNQRYNDELSQLADEYLKTNDAPECVPYLSGMREKAHEKAKEYSHRAQNLFPECDNKYMLSLLFWIHCIPRLECIYEENNISLDIFLDSMKDFSYKINECKDVHGLCGVFVDWFFLFFDLKLFELGRLQYEVASFEGTNYTIGNYRLNKGDVVYSCHIPSGGKFTADDCMDSFAKAYEFFSEQLTDDILPVVCETWLFYPPYVEKIFPKGSNISNFIGMFDIISHTSTGKDFEDGWRIFHREYDGTTETLPKDTSLQRNFISYIEDGGDFGHGYGVLLYDGKNKMILK